MTPERNPFRPTICGEDYRLAELPRDASSDVLWRESSAEEYENYVSWLADYLHAQTNIELDAKQKGIDCPRAYDDLCQLKLNLLPSSNQEPCRELTFSEKKIARAGSLGMHAAYYQEFLIDLDIGIDEVLGCKLTYSKSQLERILDRTGEFGAPAPGDEFTATPLRDRYTEEDVAERIRERLAAEALGDDVASDFCDLPWRVPLAILLRDVAEKELRIQCLSRFFICYDEESRK